MPRNMRRNEHIRSATAKRQSALARVELGQPSSPRVSAVGPVSMGVKVRDASDDLLIEAWMAQKNRPSSWYCEPCAVEVYQLRCVHCGKTKRERR